MGNKCKRQFLVLGVDVNLSRVSAHWDVILLDLIMKRKRVKGVRLIGWSDSACLFGILRPNISTAVFVKCDGFKNKGKNSMGSLLEPIRFVVRRI